MNMNTALKKALNSVNQFNYSDATVFWVNAPLPVKVIE